MHQPYEAVPTALSALAGAQEAFAGTASDFGVGDEDNVQALVDEVRGRTS